MSRKQNFQPDIVQCVIRGPKSLLPCAMLADASVTETWLDVLERLGISVKPEDGVFVCSGKYTPTCPKEGVGFKAELTEPVGQFINKFQHSLKQYLVKLVNPVDWQGVSSTCVQDQGILPGTSQHNTPTASASTTEPVASTSKGACHPVFRSVSTLKVPRRVTQQWTKQSGAPTLKFGTLPNPVRVPVQATKSSSLPKRVQFPRQGHQASAALSLEQQQLQLKKRLGIPVLMNLEDIKVDEVGVVTPDWQQEGEPVFLEENQGQGSEETGDDSEEDDWEDMDIAEDEDDNGEDDNGEDEDDDTDSLCTTLSQEEIDLRNEGIEVTNLKPEVQKEFKRFDNDFLLRVKKENQKLRDDKIAWDRYMKRSPFCSHFIRKLLFE